MTLQCAKKYSTYIRNVVVVVVPAARNNRKWKDERNKWREHGNEGNERRMKAEFLTFAPLFPSLCRNCRGFLAP